MTDFPEAPASTTYSITSKNGFNILFTVRAESGLDLLDKMNAIEAKLIKLEYKPQIKPGFKKEVEYVEGKMCPKCGGRIVIKTKSDGAKYFKCENGKYNPTTKQNFGCDFVDWNNMPVKYDSKNPYSQGNSISISEYEDYPKQ